MEDNIYLELKKRIEELSPLTEEEWADISTKWKQKTFEKNEYLLKAGQIESKFYFVYRGVHRVFGDRDGEEINVGYYKKHEQNKEKPRQTTNDETRSSF